jgi:ATP/maltotriose-dependent transcriptional regulator MalT
MAHLWRGDYEQVLALKERALRMMEGGFHLRNYVRPLLISSYACAELGRWDEAVELGQKALSKAQDFSDNELTCWAAWTISLAYTSKGDMDRAIEYGERSLETADTPALKLTAQAALARAWCHAGESKKGTEMLAVVIAVDQAAGFVTALLTHAEFLAEGYWLAGALDKAGENAHQLLELADRCGARGHVGKAHRVLAETYLKTNPTEAETRFEKSINIFREIKAENWLAHAYAGLGRLHKQQGNVEKAREFLTQALEIFERLGTLIEPDKVRQELTELP